ncbi:MAG TPA: T9SS type A sorting domain-containing protein [Paludibacteraceae bacterium]|nr:T9SS type A sorting domain-containing protein [Paludibacteraceae bacterium]
MKEKLKYIFIFLMFCLFQGIPLKGQEECTIGVALGSATSDGRPLLWKTRDYISAPNNTVKYETGTTYKFLYVANAEDTGSAWMGVNEHGFAIINSAISDLPTNKQGIGNGALMKTVLGSCKTVTEFENYLKSTNKTGRSTCANFAVMDTTGAAAIFETGGSVYYKFAATGSTPYIIRTNFSIRGGGTTGIERYNRSNTLINNFWQGDSLNFKSILRYQMRDFSDDNSNPVNVPYEGIWAGGVPYGYIYCEKSICRTSSVSATVIQGVKPSENGRLSTMWTILGQPATSIAFPLWPVGNTPIEVRENSNTSALCDEALQIRDLLFDNSSFTDYINSFKLSNGQGGGLWSLLFHIEDSVLLRSKKYLDSIRSLPVLPVNSMLTYEANCANRVLGELQKCKRALENPVVTPLIININKSIKIYPNPSNGKIYIDCGEEKKLKMKVFNILGECLTQNYLMNGINEINIDFFLTGIYILQIYDEEKTIWRKIIKN